MFNALIISVAVLQNPLFGYGNLNWVVCYSLYALIVHRIKEELLHSSYIVQFYLSCLEYRINLPKSQGLVEEISVTWSERVLPSPLWSLISQKPDGHPRDGHMNVVMTRQPITRMALPADQVLTLTAHYSHSLLGSFLLKY